jgi:hypothetical protein
MTVATPVSTKPAKSRVSVVRGPEEALGTAIAVLMSDMPFCRSKVLGATEACAIARESLGCIVNGVLQMRRRQNCCACAGEIRYSRRAAKEGVAWRRLLSG